MGLLDRLFSVWRGRDRLARAPAGHTGGKLAPASVQRAHLGVSDIDLPTGVVWLRTGEVRAVLGVGGMTLHHRDPQDALAFLERSAAALIALPPDVVLLARARPGGLDAYVAEKAAASATLASTAPGTGLARLAADQLRNARTLVASGLARDVDCWLSVRDAGGDVRALFDRASQAANRLSTAGLSVTPLKDRALSEAVAASWQPGYTETVLLDFRLRGGRDAPEDAWTLHVESDNRTVRAKVKRPRYADPDALPPAAPAPTLPASTPRRLPAGVSRKALP